MNQTNIFVRPSLFWKFMCWWINFAYGPKDQVQTGTIFYGGQLHIAIFFERPGLRTVIAQTTMTKTQDQHFHAELTKQLERFEAFS